jgi:hypothetical protein
MIINFYSKPFVSYGGFKSRRRYCYGITFFRKKTDEKRWGYWQFYYDGPFHHFGLGLFTAFWWCRADMEYIRKNNPPKELQQEQNK